MMNSYHITVQFDTTLTYRIRANSDQEAAEKLDQRVIKTMQRLDNPVIRYVKVNGELNHDNKVIELQKCSEH